MKVPGGKTGSGLLGPALFTRPAILPKDQERCLAPGMTGITAAPGLADHDTGILHRQVVEREITPKKIGIVLFQVPGYPE